MRATAARARAVASIPVRVGSLDSLRGIAVLLMITDHVLFVAAPTSVLRLTVTRAALPLFMLVAGWLWAAKGRPSSRRIWQLVAATWLASVFEVVAGFPFPSILVVYGLALVLVPLVVRWPIITTAVAIVAMATWPTPIGWWTGYHPGEVVALTGLGVLWQRLGGMPAVTVPTWVDHVGRRALTVYVGHVAAIAVVQLPRVFGPGTG